MFVHFLASFSLRVALCRVNNCLLLGFSWVKKIVLWSEENPIEPSSFSESKAWEKSNGKDKFPSSFTSTQYKLLFGVFVIGLTVTSACLLFLLDKWYIYF